VKSPNQSKDEVEAKFLELETLTSRHDEQGQLLYKACNAELFPCDILAFTVLQRSLQLKKGFCLLLRGGGYICGAGILRMQLDNILRFNGVVTSGDPHGIAERIWNGERLYKIKDSDGKKLNDSRLVELLSGRNPDVTSLYELSSSYVHLSDQQIAHFYQVSKPNNEGSRDIAISDNDDHIGCESKVKLMHAFAVVTRGVLESVRQWTEVRSSHGNNETLKERFSKNLHKS
jgi:hypothetical protein